MSFGIEGVGIVGSSLEATQLDPRNLYAHPNHRTNASFKIRKGHHPQRPPLPGSKNPHPENQTLDLNFNLNGRQIM